MTRYQVITWRRDALSWYIVSIVYKWASSDKAKATEALTRESKKFHGEDCEVDVKEY